VAGAVPVVAERGEAKGGVAVKPSVGTACCCNEELILFGLND
jgi:hypothetical protein